MTFNKEQKIFFWSVIILLILITITHLVGYLYSNEEYYYTGNQPLRSNDIFGYYSFIIQAKEGHLLFKNLYNPAPQQALFFHPLWLVMGLIVRIFNADMFLVFQIFKLIFAFIFCILLRNFLKEFYDLNKNPWLFPFCLFTGGFFTGFCELDTFLILYYNPLFILSLIFFILIFYSTLKYFKKHQSYYLLIIFSSSLLLFLTHFYDAVSLIAIIFTWCVYQYLINKKIKDFFPGLTSLLAISLGGLYYFIIFSQEEALRQWALNNVTLLPSWQYLVFGFGFLIPLAILGALNYRKVKGSVFLIIWCMAQLYVILSPIPFNSRLVLGLSIPLAILAYQGFLTILKKIKINVLQLISVWLILIALIHNNLFMVIVDFRIIGIHNGPQYERKNHITTFYWMRDNLPKESLIFANCYYWDTKISGYTGLISYTGAAGFSARWIKDFDKILWFFQDNQFNEKKLQFLKDNKINYLFYSNMEKSLGDYSPMTKNYLKLIYKKQDAEVYQVL